MASSAGWPRLSAVNKTHVVSARRTANAIVRRAMGCPEVIYRLVLAHFCLSDCGEPHRLSDRYRHLAEPRS